MGTFIIYITVNPVVIILYKASIIIFYIAVRLLSLCNGIGNFHYKEIQHREN